MIQELDKIPLQVIIEFRRTGTSSYIKPELQKYIRHIDRAIELMRVNGNISSNADKLRAEFASDNLSFNTARDRIYDAISIFHLNNDVKNAAWDQYYADRLEDLHEKCISEKNYTEARRCIERAHDYRTRDNQKAIDIEKIKPRKQIISPEVTHKRLGIEEERIILVWNKAQKFIKNLPIDSLEKQRLLNEGSLNVGLPIDAEYENAED